MINKEPTSQEHDFNWVESRNECSVSVEFVAMQREVRKNVDDRNDQCPSFKKHNRINLFEYENRIGHQQFCVRRHDAYGGRVCFQEHENHILIEWIGMNGEPAKAPIKITLTLNNEGECRYRIDMGECECLRWQILRDSLEGLFFL